ncbi:hypothetical protein VE02_08700 [Pseudogymnoascus sp. 03VT05]|nr:hypothetical protein VE02_08700 [Pseudogymnoascus sp. 03VT05]
MYKTDREGLAQRYTAYRPGAATPEVDDETDGKRLAQQAMDYGPAFAPYTTKLLKRTEGWESRPALWDISPGCLLWLPPYYKNPNGTNLRHPHPDSLNRPIVVLSVDVSGPEDAIVTFMNIRSFKLVGAKTSLPNFWKKHLPLSRLPRENWRDDPEARDSWKDALLFRENYMGREINRMQYVDIQHISTARWEDLRCYRGERRIIGARQRVCENSMAQLRAARTWWEGHRNMGRGLVNWEDEWVPTGELRDVFRRRYIEPLGNEDNELGSVVAGRASNDASEGIGELVLQMEGLRAEMRAEFEETRNKMRAGLHKVKTGTRSKLMTRMIEELEDVREGLQVVNRAEMAVVELELAKSARPPMPPPEYATSPQLAVWHAANDTAEWSGDLTNKVEAMRLELKMGRIEVDGMRAEMGRMRDDMDKMKMDLALLKRADAAREAAGRRKSVKVQKAGMYVPALGPRAIVGCEGRTAAMGNKRRIGRDGGIDTKRVERGVEASDERPGRSCADTDSGSFIAASGSGGSSRAGPAGTVQGMSEGDDEIGGSYLYQEQASSKGFKSSGLWRGLVFAVSVHYSIYTLHI